MSALPVLVVMAPGTNRERDTAEAIAKACAKAVLCTLDELTAAPKKLRDHRFVIFPGGFSHADDFGAGNVLAHTLRYALADELQRFVDEGRALLGICNGFQALLRAGLFDNEAQAPKARLVQNQEGRFECRWVSLRVKPSSPCIFTQGLEVIECPVAHGEGRLVFDHKEDAQNVPLFYDEGQNPNGSEYAAASLCNARGNVMGLMPHPENHISHLQHPHPRAQRKTLGLALFERGVSYASQL